MVVQMRRQIAVPVGAVVIQLLELLHIQVGEVARVLTSSIFLLHWQHLILTELVRAGLAAQPLRLAIQMEHPGVAE
jgi:hypothetical protein